MGVTDAIVQILGLGVSAGLCFMGYVGRGGCDIFPSTRLFLLLSSRFS